MNTLASAIGPSPVEVKIVGVRGTVGSLGRRNFAGVIEGESAGQRSKAIYLCKNYVDEFRQDLVTPGRKAAAQDLDPEPHSDNLRDSAGELYLVRR
ncbi:hypothetical protein [Bradyrhizobium sp. WSM2793]|uniref:hypothetical protein n=1 Tax=Bradyrhizobium sp. WSM2793 TaxID=1038866 RepID=UPI0003740415|nr:hypothetical protein [Bradyrhizobium sp. WSM2793]